MSKTNEGKDYLMADRVAIYILRLKSGGSLSIPALSVEFGVHVRTIYRDFTCLERHLPLARTVSCTGEIRYHDSIL